MNTQTTEGQEMDISERIRKEAERLATVSDFPLIDLAKEAADAISRLTAELEGMRAAIEDIRDVAINKNLDRGHRLDRIFLQACAALTPSTPSESSGAKT